MLLKMISSGWVKYVRSLEDKSISPCLFFSVNAYNSEMNAPACRCGSRLDSRWCCGVDAKIRGRMICSFSIVILGSSLPAGRSQYMPLSTRMCSGPPAPGATGIHPFVLIYSPSNGLPSSKNASISRIEQSFACSPHGERWHMFDDYDYDCWTWAGLEMMS